MSPVEFVRDTPKADGQRLHHQMRREVEWLLIQGWQLDRKADGVYLHTPGQTKIVRGGVLING